MRHRFTRGLIGEILKATKLEKLSLILPFIVLIIDAEIFYYSLKRGEEMIIIFSSFVLFLSVVEIITVMGEIGLYMEKARRNEEIEKHLIEIAKKTDNPTVKKIIDEFMNKYEGYSYQEVYPIACRIVDLLKKE